MGRRVNPGDELGALALQPGLVDRPGPAHHRIEQAGVQAAVGVTGQVDHDRYRPVVPIFNGRQIIHPEAGYPGQPLGPGEAALGLGLDRVPAGVPVHPEPVCQRRDGGVIVGEVSTDRAPAYAGAR